MDKKEQILHDHRIIRKTNLGTLGLWDFFLCKFPDFPISLNWFFGYSFLFYNNLFPVADDCAIVRKLIKKAPTKFL